MMRKISVLLSVLTAVVLVSCSSEKTPRRGTFRRNPQVFHKLKDYSLQLSLLSSKREFYAGDDQVKLTFALKNTGLRPVTIYEWHTCEAANIRLYYRAGKAGEKAAPESWKISAAFDPNKVDLKSRSPLTLNPGNNKALIQIPAAFLKEISNRSGRKTPYTLRAVLNLQSVTVESEETEIYIK